MSASATASSFLALPTLTPKTQLLCNSPPSFSVKFHAKPISLSSQLFSRTSASRFVRHVAVSSELDQEDDFTSDGDDSNFSPNFSPDLKLFVGNLPFTVDSAQLAGLFESVGNIEMVEVIYDKETGRSRGFGFVTMSTVEEVEAAAQQFNGYEFEGRQLRVNYGPPPPKRESNFSRGGGYESRGPRGGGYESRGGYENRGPRGDSYESRGPRGGGGAGGSFNSPNKVHVSNLSWGVDDAALESLFSEQGNVLEAKVIYDRDTGRSRGFGFVTYGSADEVSSAINSLDGADLDGRQIRVSEAENKPRRSF